jgi:hypothetical protein
MVLYLCRNVTIVCGASYQLLGSQISFEIRRSGSTLSQILHQQLEILVNRNIQQAMIPAIMPWPMTLAPTNEAVRRENCAEKNLDVEKN